MTTHASFKEDEDEPGSSACSKMVVLPADKIWLESEPMEGGGRSKDCVLFKYRNSSLKATYLVQKNLAPSRQLTNHLVGSIFTLPVLEFISIQRFPFVKVFMVASVADGSLSGCSCSRHCSCCLRHISLIRGFVFLIFVSPPFLRSSSSFPANRTPLEMVHRLSSLDVRRKS